MGNWSTDRDVFLLEPGALDALSRRINPLAEGADGATAADGVTFTSAAVADWSAAGVTANHFLEITSGDYQDFYGISAVASAALTLGRQVTASGSALKFAVRTFDDFHDEAHQHYQDYIIRVEDDEEWDDDELHANSQRQLRDLCVARVLGRICWAASREKDDIWWVKAERWSAREKRLFTSLGELWKDVDSDGERDEITTHRWGSVEAGIS